MPYFVCRYKGKTLQETRQLINELIAAGEEHDSSAPDSSTPATAFATAPDSAVDAAVAAAIAGGAIAERVGKRIPAARHKPSSKAPSSAEASIVHDGVGDVAATAGEAATDVDATAPKKRRTRQPKAAAAKAAADTAEAVGATAEGAAAADAADDGNVGPQSATKRSRSKRAATKSSQPADADMTEADAVNGANSQLNSQPDDVEPVKPVKRTKKLIREEIQAEARQGLFNGVASLVNDYSHIELFSSQPSWGGGEELGSQDPFDGVNSMEAGVVTGIGGTLVKGETQPDELQQTGSFDDTPPAEARGAVGEGSQGVIEEAVRGVDNIAELQMENEDHHTCSCTDLDGDHLPQLASPPVLSTTAVHPSSKAVVAAVNAAVLGQSETEGDQDLLKELQAIQVAAAVTNGIMPRQQLYLKPHKSQAQVLPNLGYACLCMTLR